MAEQYEVPITQETNETGVVPGPQAPLTQAEPRPDWLPEKYARPEDMALAHANAEARLTQLQQQIAGQPAPAVDANGNPVTPPVPQVPDVNSVPELAGEALQGYYNEFAAHGALSNASYQELQSKYGIPANLVNAHIAGLQGQAERDAEDLYQIVGGKEQYDAMGAWAVRSMSTEEQQGYNSLIANANASGDKNLLAMAVKSLATRWQESEGRRGPVSPIPTAPAMMGQGYSTPEEAAEAVADPKYKTSAAFRQQHYTRLAASQY